MALAEITSLADADVIPTREELVARARALGPRIKQRALEGDAQRQLSKETIAEMKDAGLFRILQPRRWGGYELDLRTFYEVQLVLAEHDMSVGWVHGVVATHSWQMAVFDDRAAQDAWGEDSSALIASSYMPVGKVNTVDGGFNVSGRWRFSSGSHHTDWFFLGAILPPDAEGVAHPATVMIPKEDVTILDTWDVAGLKSTGSHDVVVENAFVPSYRIHRHIDGFNCTSPGNAVNTGPLYRVPFLQAFLRAVSTASIGALQAMVNEFIDYGGGKVTAFGSKTAEDPTAQLIVGEALSAIDEMKTLLFRTMDNLMEIAERGDVPTIEERLRYKYQASEVANRCAVLAGRLYRATGGSGLFNQHPFARVFANINAGRQHMISQYEGFGANYGGFMMGRQNTDFAL